MLEDTPASKALSALLTRLDVTACAPDRFLGPASRGGGPRLFGGLVAGQAVVAAARTVEAVGGIAPALRGGAMSIDGIAPALRGGAMSMQLHSLHAYFLQPGDPALDVEYEVQRLKEGKNFHARLVTGRQDGRVIFSMQASFQRAEPGLSHQDPMPAAPPPEQIGDRSFGFWGASSPVLMRDCDGSFEQAAQNGLRRTWMRPAAALPEDPVLHTGLLVFASDMTLVMTGVLPHPELRNRPRGGASLDHAMWFHRTMPFDDWMLYTMQTPAGHGGRPLINGAMYRRDGTRIATVAQEGLIRARR